MAGEKHQMKFSTLIVRLEEITDNKIFYISKTDITGREYSYIIPRSSHFPYEKLREGHWYTIVCVTLNNTWHWYICFNLSESETLVDSEIAIGL